jgi:hypothetical protein
LQTRATTTTTINKEIKSTITELVEEINDSYSESSHHNFIGSFTNTNIMHYNAHSAVSQQQQHLNFQSNELKRTLSNSLLDLTSTSKDVKLKSKTITRAGSESSIQNNTLLMNSIREKYKNSSLNIDHRHRFFNDNENESISLTVDEAQTNSNNDDSFQINPNDLLYYADANADNNTNKFWLQKSESDSKCITKTNNEINFTSNRTSYCNNDITLAPIKSTEINTNYQLNKYFTIGKNFTAGKKFKEIIKKYV